MKYVISSKCTLAPSSGRIRSSGLKMLIFTTLELWQVAVDFGGASFSEQRQNLNFREPFFAPIFY